MERKLAVECIFCSACIRFVECCPQEGLTEKLCIGLENFVFDWLINAVRVVSQVEYSSLVDLRGLLLDLVAQLLGALSRIRFSSVTERFFMELNIHRIDTSVARSEALSIINGMRYLKLGVKTEGGLNASASFVAKANRVFNRNCPLSLRAHTWTLEALPSASLYPCFSALVGIEHFSVLTEKPARQIESYEADENEWSHGLKDSCLRERVVAMH